MNISELTKDSKRVDVQGVVEEVQEPRTVNYKQGGTGQVMHCTLKDASGTIDFVVWNDDIPLVKKDSIVSLSNGYCSEYPKDSGKIQLQRGKFGRMTIQ